jgi:hypothetical protein
MSKIPSIQKFLDKRINIYYRLMMQIEQSICFLDITDYRLKTREQYIIDYYLIPAIEHTYDFIIDYLKETMKVDQVRTIKIKDKFLVFIADSIFQIDQISTIGVKHLIDVIQFKHDACGHMDQMEKIQWLTLCLSFGTQKFKIENSSERGSNQLPKNFLEELIEMRERILNKDLWKIRMTKKYNLIMTKYPCNHTDNIKKILQETCDRLQMEYDQCDNILSDIKGWYRELDHSSLSHVREKMQLLIDDIYTIIDDIPVIIDYKLKKLMKSYDKKEIDVNVLNQ